MGVADLVVSQFEFCLLDHARVRPVAPICLPNTYGRPMPVENHPKYDEWSKALDRLKEANDRFRAAKDSHAPHLEMAREDLRKAQSAYDLICEEID